MNPLPEVPDRVMDPKELAAYLKISHSWVKAAISARRIPFTLVGRQARFFPHHVRQIIAAGEQTPVGAGRTVTPMRRRRSA